MRERDRKKLKMPDLVGLREEDAAIALRNAGFKEVPRVRFVESYESVGTVVAQEPIKGNLVDNYGVVVLRVSRRSYLRHLPQIYQTDAALGNDFLREFLWVFQHIQLSVSRKLDQGWHYYDPRETPEEFLPWLANWVALTLDVDWPDIKKRKLISAAAELYKHRGTKRALRDVIRIFLDREPRIEENKWPYPGFRVGVTSSVGVDTIVLPQIDLDHCFMVHIPVGVDEVTEEMVVKIHNLINMEKPAHATYFLQFQTEERRATPQVFMQIGVSSLGVPDLRYDEEETSGDSAPMLPESSVVETPVVVPTAIPAARAARSGGAEPAVPTNKKKSGSASTSRGSHAPSADEEDRNAPGGSEENG